jgi:hypothetical protein
VDRVDLEKQFFTTDQAAFEAGIQKRQFARIAKSLGLEPLVFEKCHQKTGGAPEVNRWTPAQIRQVAEFRESGYVPTVIDRPHGGAAIARNPVAGDRVCIHCAHSRPDGWRCCQCGEPCRVTEFPVAMSLAFV